MNCLLFHTPVLSRRCLWTTRSAASRTPASNGPAVCFTVKSVGEPDALIGHVRFDERGWETERCRMAQATAPILDSTDADASITKGNVRSLGRKQSRGPVLLA